MSRFICPCLLEQCKPWQHRQWPQSKKWGSCYFYHTFLSTFYCHLLWPKLLDIQPKANAFNSYFRSLLGIDSELLGAKSFEFIPASSSFSHCSNKQKTTTPDTVLELWWGCSHVGEAGEEKREAKETHVYTHTHRGLAYGLLVLKM